MPQKEIQEHLAITCLCICPCVKDHNWFSYIILCKTYCKSSSRLSVSETSLHCGLVVHINLVTACFVQASDDRLLKMRIDHHNQQPFRLINRSFLIILCKTYCKSSSRLSVSETSLPCGLVVHINLVTAYFVQASDDRLLKMRIDHHNQQPFRLINRSFLIIGTSLVHPLITVNMFAKPDKEIHNG